MMDKEPLLPTPDGPVENAITLVISSAALLGLGYAAWTIGTGWGWIAFAATTGLIALFMEVRNLNNTLVRTLPTLRPLLGEVSRLRRLQQDERGTRKSTKEASE
jgi:hypothetical protein